MTDTLATILQWLIPSGGLGAAIAWITSRVLRNIRETKEVHDTYKTLYEDISRTLKDLQNEVDDLHKELGRFRRAVSKIYSCRYYPDCPVGRELQNSEANDNRKNKRESHRQPAIRSPSENDNGNSDVEGQSGDSDDELEKPPCASLV